MSNKLTLICSGKAINIASGKFRHVVHNFMSIYIHIRKRYRNMCNRMCGHNFGEKIQSFFSFMNTTPVSIHMNVNYQENASKIK